MTATFHRKYFFEVNFGNLFRASNRTEKWELLKDLKAIKVIMKPCIIVHGGASNIADAFVDGHKTGTQDAARTGYAVLKEGGSALDAVCAAVTSLEDNPVFDAGRGSCFTREGTIEMDSLIMDGDTLRVGAVAGVTDIANPVQLAKRVLQDTPHCMLIGAGASKFAKQIGHPVLADPSELIVEESVLKAKLDGKVKYEHNVKTYFNDVIHTKNMEELEEIASKMAKTEGFDASNGSVGHDTVGAVAIDATGRIACATSTGGIPGKWVGRVGATPLTGCGAYANRFGGATSTGHGESMMKVTLSRQAVSYMENGADAQTAAEKAIEYLGNETKGRGGIICISKDGEVGHTFSTFRMGWALVIDDKIKYGIDNGKEFEANLD